MARAGEEGRHFSLNIKMPVFIINASSVKSVGHLRGSGAIPRQFK